MRNNQISTIVRSCRAVLGWNQAKLATESGLAVTSIARIEQGKVGLQLKTYDKLILVFKNNGITVARNDKNFTLTIGPQINDSASDIPE